jgi:hypothetical protein
MVKINQEFEIEFPNEFNDELSNFAVKVGDEIKDMPPLERFYALKLILEELDGRISMYTVMDMISQQNDRSVEIKTNSQ